MSNGVLIVDNNMLSQLYRAGGASAWDSLVSASDRILITDAVILEAADQPYAADLLTWTTTLEAEGRFISPDYTFDEINTRYGTSYSPTNTNGFGDATMRYFVDSGDAAGLNYTLASSDGALINYFKTNLQSTPYESVSGFLATELMEGRLSKADYNQLRDSILADQQVLDSIPERYRDLWFSAEELEQFNPDLQRPGGGGAFSTKNVLGLAAGLEVLRQAGVVGDVIGLAVTSAEASALIEQGREAEAEQVWAEYAGGLAGGALGAAAAGIAAGAVVASTGVGAPVGAAIIVASVLIGGYAGDQVGQAFASEISELIQQKLNAGEPIILDDIINEYDGFVADRGLNIEGVIASFRNGTFFGEECFLAGNTNIDG